MAGKEEWYDHGQSMQSCALAGASAMIAGITDSLMIANGPAWCYFYAMRVTDRPELNLGQRFRCTYPSNGAVVFGTEKEVVEALTTIKNMKEQPGLVLLENSCALSLIGDDLQGIADSVGLDCPIITLDSGGLLGDYWQGYQKALLETLKISAFDEYQCDEEVVNFIGCSVNYYNEESDLKELKRLLELVGITVQLTIGVGHTMKDLSCIKKASLNIVIHPELGEEGAKWLEKEMNMPYISPILPYGLKGTLEWVKEIINALDLRDKEIRLSKIESIIGVERKRNFEYLKEMQRLWGEPWFDQVLVAGPGSILKGIERVLTSEWLDAGFVHFVYHDAMNSYEPHYYNIQSNAWQSILENFDGGLLLGTNHEKKLLQEKYREYFSWQAIGMPVDDEVVLSERPFMGIEGNRRMSEIIWNLYIQAVEKQTLFPKDNL